MTCAICTPPAGCAGLVTPSRGGMVGDTVPASDGPDAFENDSANDESPPLAANTTCWRWYGPPAAVRVVSAFAMLADTISARMRSACMALPDVSISPKRFTDHSNPVGVLRLAVLPGYLPSA